MVDPVSIGMGAANAVGGLVSGISNAVLGSKQLKLQREQFEYQKQLNQQVMEREDTAVQRRAADMAEAGINKNLAAGAPADTASMSAGAPVGTGGAEMMTKGLGAVGDSIGMAMSAMRSIEEVKNIARQSELTKADVELRQQELFNEQKRAGLIDKETELKAEEAIKMRWNQQMAEAFNMPHGQIIIPGLAQERSIMEQRKKDGGFKSKLQEMLMMSLYGAGNAAKGFFSSSAPNAYNKGYDETVRTERRGSGEIITRKRRYK